MPKDKTKEEVIEEKVNRFFHLGQEVGYIERDNFEKALTEAYEAGREAERERIRYYINHTLQRDWKTEKEYNTALADVVRLALTQEE